MLSKNSNTSELFKRLIETYSKGNLSKFAVLVEKDRAYISKLVIGKHSITFEILFEILQKLEPGFLGNGFELIQEILNKVK